MNKFFLIIAFLALNCFPAFSVNAIPAKLMALGICLLLIDWKPVKAGIVGKLYLAWLAWAAVGCFGSPWYWHAIQGYHSRQEGLLEYLMLTTFAYLYWQTCKNCNALALGIGILGLFLPLLARQLEPATFNWLCSPPVAQSTLFAIGLVMLYSIHRSFAIVAIWGLVNATMRSGLIAALSGILVYEILACRPIMAVKSMKTVLAASAAGFVVLAGILHITPLGTKLKATSFDLTGSRSQWLIQSYDAAMHMPLFGYGLDCGSEILKPAGGPTADVGAIADRSHNIIMDILLFTGWPGLALACSIYGLALGVTLKERTPINLTCFSGLTAFVVCGLFNPLGIPGICLALVCLFGFKREKTS